MHSQSPELQCLFVGGPLHGMVTFASGVAGDTCDTVMADGVTKDGKRAHFESELYHLGVWCDEYGFKCKIEKHKCGASFP